MCIYSFIFILNDVSNEIEVKSLHLFFYGQYVCSLESYFMISIFQKLAAL